MTIEKIIKEAFSRGWNASNECATDFDYDCALNGFLSEYESEVKKFCIGAVAKPLTQAQDNVIFVLKKYPNEMIMHNGWLTGGHGIQFDRRTLNSLEKRGIIVRGKLSPSYCA